MRLIILTLSLFSICWAVLEGAGDPQAYEKFIPTQNPYQVNSFFRISSYNANFFSAISDQNFNLKNMAYDLHQLRSFVLVMQEFPISFYKSPYYPKMKEMLVGMFGMSYFCESFVDDGYHRYGVVTASRYSIGTCKVIQMNQDELFSHVEVEYNGRFIPIIASHMERAAEANVERVDQMNLIVDYIKTEAQLEGSLYIIAIDTTLQYTDEAIWTLRTKLGIEDSYAMLDWTRPSYTTFEGITRNYMFLSEKMRGMPVGTYVLQSTSDSFAVLIDLWKYPDETTMRRKIVGLKMRGDHQCIDVTYALKGGMPDNVDTSLMH